jgi:hypothetical protein
MTKKIFKKNLTKRKNVIKRTKKNKKMRITKKNKRGGELSDEYKEKTQFRRTLYSIIRQISNRNTSRNKIKDGINLLINFFKSNLLINTLIPVSIEGKYVEKNISSIKIVDFVSPITFMLNSFWGNDLISDKDIVRILNAYFLNSGNFNNLSSRFKESPFKHEVYKQHVSNVMILLNKDNQFRIIEDGLDEATKTKLVELIPNKQQITTLQQIEEPQPEIDAKFILPYPLPTDNNVGYDRAVIPEFWKPIFENIFENRDELLEIRNQLMILYEYDRYKNDNKKNFKICQLLESLFPGYLTKSVLEHRESIKTLVNVNILNCFITLFYGLIVYRLYATNQDYLFIFKGGRALQLNLVDIPGIGKYGSEDTDILIIPNTFTNGVYNFDKMKNLSEHTAYLLKWIMPEEINIFISLTSNPKNKNKDITKILYNDGKLFKAVSDIGFGEINEDIRQYFVNYQYSPIFIDQFDKSSLFITPTIDDMLAEKIFYYAKYLKYQNMIIIKEPIIEQDYATLTSEECDHLLVKFKRAILKLVDAILRRDYFNADDGADFELIDSKKLIVREILKGYHDFSNQEKEDVVLSIYPS